MMENNRRVLDVIPFQSLGKPRMREWIQINHNDSQAYRHYESVILKSIRHLLATPEKLN